jgi:hypothetical protein
MLTMADCALAMSKPQAEACNREMMVAWPPRADDGAGPALFIAHSEAARHSGARATSLHNHWGSEPKNLRNLVLGFASGRSLAYDSQETWCPVSRSAEVPEAEDCEIKETAP